MFLPLMLGMLATAVPFSYALYQGLLLLSYIDKNSAFSELSVKAIKKIKYSAGVISVLYALMMPYIIYVADKDDAPGAVIIGLVFIFAPFVIAVFAAVLERLLQNAIDIKSENDLTV
jgi:ABC-type sulfate transport system permease component